MSHKMLIPYIVKVSVLGYFPLVANTLSLAIINCSYKIRKQMYTIY